MKKITALAMSMLFFCVYQTASANNTAKAKWTIMVYMAADNDLDTASYIDIMEMLNASTNSDINILVQVDRKTMEPFTTCRRFRIERGLNYYIADGKKVIDIDEINTGDPDELTKFLDWGIREFPAEHYGLIIWNHGGGWRFAFQTVLALDGGKPGFKAIGADDTNGGDRLFNHEIGMALKNSKELGALPDKKLDFIGFDACLMGMTEVWYELKDYARWGIGSEDLVSGYGFEYQSLIATVIKNQDDAAKLYAGILDTYSASMKKPEYLTEDVSSKEEIENGELHHTLSLVNLSEVDALAKAVSTLSIKLGNNKKEMTAARTPLTPYDFDAGQSWPNGIDLKQFLLNLKKEVNADIALKGEIDKVLLQFDKTVVKHVQSKSRLASSYGSHGLTIYFPVNKSTYDKDPEGGAYTKDNADNPVAFVKNLEWEKFLKNYYGTGSSTRASGSARR